MSATVEGTDPVLVSSRVSRTDRGTDRVDEWVGSESGINAVLSSLVSTQRWEWDNSAGPKIRLIVRTPEPGTSGAGGSSAATTYEYAWELVGSDTTKDLRKHPSTLLAIQSATANPGDVTTSSKSPGENDMEAIIRLTDNPDEGNEFLPQSAGAAREVFIRLYKLMIKGHKDFLWPHYELRFNAVVSPSFDAGINEDGTLSVYTSGQIISEYSNFPMPTRMAARANALQAMNPALLFGVSYSDLVGFSWGWLKKTSSESQLPDFKVRYSTSWDLELWNTDYIYIPR